MRMLNNKLRTTNNGWYFILGVWFGRKLAWATSWPVTGRESYNKAQYKSTFSHVKDPVSSRSVSDTETEQHSIVTGLESRYFGQVASYINIPLLSHVNISDEFQMDMYGYSISDVSFVWEYKKSFRFKPMWHWSIFLIIYLLYFELCHSTSAVATDLGHPYWIYITPMACTSGCYYSF